uniref:Uncharacterized protein n=1 Tax=Romanomermis culicivorax TaxID=13658 RepID=A0A915IF30_ROMCU
MLMWDKVYIEDNHGQQEKSGENRNLDVLRVALSSLSFSFDDVTIMICCSSLSLSSSSSGKLVDAAIIWTSSSSTT